MASQTERLQQIEQALHKADAAGDEQAARQLAAAYREAKTTLDASNARKEEFFANAPTQQGPREHFDAIRPGYGSDMFGEDVSRGIDAAAMGWGEQADSLINGVKNAWATVTGNDEEKDRIAEEARQSREFGEETYRGSNPNATMAGEIATTAPMAVMPGGLPTQIALGATEYGLDYDPDQSGLMNAGVGAATTGVFGMAFDFLGRAFKNGLGGVADTVSPRTPRVAGQGADETARLAKIAKDEGVNMTPGQRTRSRRQMQDEARMASQPYGQKINDIKDAQTEKINQMVMDRFGIKNADNITPNVRRQMDETITNAYQKAEEGLTRTVGDETFLTNSVGLATDDALTAAQKAQLEAVGKRVNQGMDGKELMNLRKKLQKQVKNNQQSNGDFADSLNSMVSEIDDLIERTAPEGVAMQFADARDMARVRMAIEKGAAIGKDGNINPRSLDTALGSVYQKEFKRGAGAANEGTQRVFDAARLGTFLSDGIPNSGTATRESRGLLDAAIDKTIREPMVDFHLKHPNLYGIFDPMGELGKTLALNAGRLAGGGAEDLEENAGLLQEALR
jgi:hypothetical protein